MCSNDDRRLTFDFLRQGQIYISMHLYWESIEKSVSQNELRTNDWNLQSMIKVANPFSYNQAFVPGIICPYSWAIYLYKIS